MSYSKPVFHHPNLTKNALGYTKKDYEGSLSTLCAGCGHDSISAAIVEACFELNIEPHRVAKLSGIGCSSKTPAYFLNNSHGFNSVHGRMPSIATGANLANRDLIYLGVSGDGDTASIGMGQFCHVIRRNLNMIYVVMNNGCYGLTKGQDSATADKGSIAKAGNMNPFEGIDLCSLAIELGATFVAQSFSGDKSQLIPILQAAMSHKGFALVNVISPCVTFNNNNGSTKSYDYVREHNESMGRIDFVPIGEEITTQYADDEVKEVKFHDGSEVLFHKLRKDF
ncbi:MAG: 2-oxoacid:ferredoxin oxidoreductase subunit beta, partial [Saprospiraceae bacterium]|nr:2-oxoacid:ferredoxin oxidoreductase subunit beta [Saprospiraceae bacterium]